MKNFLIVVFLFISLFIYGQSPDKINYQSIVRDLSGNVIQNQPISLRISILSTSITGSVVYQETFQPTTNDFGLVNIKIGEGAAVVGTMSGVDWSSGPFFLESAVDVSGGSNYTVVSTSQFMSVPYALYANESPLDTNIVQNIVSLQTSNYLDSSAVQNLIDNSSTTNIDSSTVASWGYLDSNSIMIIINNTALDSLGIQNMIDNSINNVDSSTVSSWGYLDSITIQNLINNSVSNVDSSTVANWGYLDSNSIMVLINNNSIDSITVASWGYLDSVSIQNMINNSIVNVDSTSIANFGYVAGPHTIDTDTQIDSTGIALMGYLDSVSIRNMIDSAITSALLSSSNNSGSTFGEFRDITDSVIIGNTMVDTLRSPSDGLIIVRGKSFGSSPLPVMLLRTDTLKSFTSNAGQPISYYKIWAPNQTNAVSSMTCPVKKDWYWEIRTNVNAIIEKVYWIPIINDSNNSSTIDSTTIANLGFIAGNTDTQIDSTGIASLGFVAGSTVDTQIDSTGIANLGYVAGPKTIDTDTQLDSAGVAALGFVAGSTVDTQIDSTGIAALGYVAGPKTIDTDTQLDSAGVAALGYIAGNTDTQIDSAGIASFGYLDSVSIRNMIDSLVTQSSSSSGSGSGIDFLYPDGKNNITSFFLSNQMNISQPTDFYAGTTTVINDTSYSPPTGKKLYIQEVYIRNQGNTPDILKINGITMITGGAQFVHFSQPIILSENDTLVLAPSSVNFFRYYPSSIKGFLVDANVDVEAITFQPTYQGYQVPANKMLVITNLHSNYSSYSCPNCGLRSSNDELVVNSNGFLDFWVTGTGATPLDNNYLKKPLIFSSGELIKSYNDIVNGYLVDEDFFNSSSGSSGSGSSTTIDSTTIANLGFIAGNTDTQIDSTGIASLGFVAGSTVDTQIDSTGIANLGYVAGPHTIDTDTDTQIDSAGIANYGFVDSVTVMNMINQYSSNSSGGSGSGTGNSFIFPEGYNGTPITHFFGSGSYTVPTGKSLYVTIRYSTSGDLKINNTTVSSGTNNYGGGSLGLFLPLILNSGDILSSTSSSSSFHGFLVNENLSSITHSFGSSNYTVPADKTLYILNRYSTSGDLKINNTTVSSGTNNYGGGSAGLLLPVIVSPGDIVSSTNSSTSFNGYLADSAYFESSSSNIDSAAIAAMGFVDSVTVQNMIDSAVAASSSGSGNSSGHYVGELYGGGVVFYVDHTGENGLIVSTTDANTSGAQWSTSYNNISNCDSKINGDSNTLSILNNGNGPAALLCDSYNSGGYNDWYLPAIWEFNLLSKNAYPVMKTLEGISNSDFFQETYWTSTQGSNPVYAYIFRLVSPSTASHMISWSGKDESYAVRAIRKFTSSSGSGSGSSNGNSSGNKTLIYQTNGF